MWLGAQQRFFIFDGRATPSATKPAIELAIVLYALRKAGKRRPEFDQLPLDALDNVFRSLVDRQGIRFAPIRRIGDVLLAAANYAVLRDAGNKALPRRAPLRAAINGGVLESEDRLAFHMMEERLLLNWAGLAHDLPKLTELAGRSILAHRLSALRLGERAAYQLTHDIMFLTGLDPATEMREAGVLDRVNLAQVIADLLVVFAGEAHWDLLGELLLCWDCLNLPQDALYEACWRLMLAAQDEDGSFPGPSLPENKKPPETEATRFGERYHTTLVMALALNGRARRETLASVLPLPGETARPMRRPELDLERDFTWLAGLLRRPGANSAAVACGVLIGAHLCGALNPSLSAELPSIIRLVTLRLEDASDFVEAPPALLLSAYALLSNYGHPVERLSRYVEQVHAILAELPAASAEDDVILCEKRVLLHVVGLADRPPGVSAGRAREAIDALAPDADADTLRRTVLTVESSAGYGLYDQVGDAPAALLLSRHAVRFLRRNDLATGCALLRAAHHLSRLPDERCDEFVHDLLMRQGPSGGYGHIVTTENMPFDRDLRLHLPNTLTCLWTLAELRPNFSLYPSLRRTFSTDRILSLEMQA